jgi:hypothetical protein
MLHGGCSYPKHAVTTHIIGRIVRVHDEDSIVHGAGERSDYAGFVELDKIPRIMVGILYEISTYFGENLSAFMSADKGTLSRQEKSAGVLLKLYVCNRPIVNYSRFNFCSGQPLFGHCNNTTGLVRQGRTLRLIPPSASNPSS